MKFFFSTLFILTILSCPLTASAASSGDWHASYDPMAQKYRERYNEEPVKRMLHYIEGRCGGINNQNYECWDKAREAHGSKSKKK